MVDLHLSLAVKPGSKSVGRALLRVLLALKESTCGPIVDEQEVNHIRNLAPAFAESNLASTLLR